MDGTRRASVQENLQKVHHQMETDLKNSVSRDQLFDLKNHFKRKPIPLSEIERIKNFSQLWEALEEYVFQVNLRK
jgi:hypothetical protein